MGGNKMPDDLEFILDGCSPDDDTKEITSPFCPYKGDEGRPHCGTCSGYYGIIDGQLCRIYELLLKFEESGMKPYNGGKNE
jgi:hypothetical protein